MKKQFFTASALLLATFPSFAAPDKPAETLAKTPTAKKKVVRVAGKAFVRFLHAVPGGPSADILAGENKIASNLQYKAISSYQEIKSGKNNLKVVAGGKTLVEVPVSLTRSKYFTVAIYGKEKVALLAINESSGTLVPTKSRIRVVNVAPGAPTIIIAKPSTRKTSKTGYSKVIAKPLAYGKSASKTLAPTSMTLQLRDETTGKLLNETKDVKVEAGKRMSAFVVGEMGSLDLVVAPAAQ